MLSARQSEYGAPPPDSKIRLLLVSFGQLWCDKRRY